MAYLFYIFARKNKSKQNHTNKWIIGPNLQFKKGNMYRYITMWRDRTEKQLEKEKAKDSKDL